jgi:hypothetical protein
VDAAHRAERAPRSERERQGAVGPATNVSKLGLAEGWAEHDEHYLESEGVEPSRVTDSLHAHLADPLRDFRTRVVDRAPVRCGDRAARTARRIEAIAQQHPLARSAPALRGPPPELRDAIVGLLRAGMHR